MNMQPGASADAYDEYMDEAPEPEELTCQCEPGYTCMACREEESPGYIARHNARRLRYLLDNPQLFETPAQAASRLKEAA